MITLLRLLQGYVVFEAIGGFTERFLNLCKINNVNLWNVKNDGVKVIAFTSRAEFMRITVPAENSGMSINVLSQKGLPFFVRRHKWRCGAVAGVAFIVSSLLFVSSFIWDVELVSTDGVKIDGFTEKLDELGVRVGARKKNVDILAVQEELLDSFSQLSWVSVNIFGTKAQVEYTYAKPQLPMVDKNDYTNIVAKKDGRIVLVEGYSGTNIVKRGDFVTKGSLLISGVVKNADLSESIVHASGRVFAQTKTAVISNSLSLHNVETIQSSERDYFFNFFWFSIPLGRKADDGLSETTAMLLEGNDTVLPIGITRVDTVCSVKAAVELSERELLLFNLLECVEEKRAGFEDTEIEAVSSRITEDGVVLEIECVENIAEEISIETE